MRLLGMI